MYRSPDGPKHALRFKLWVIYLSLLGLTIIVALSTGDWAVLLAAPLTSLFLAPMVLLILKPTLYFLPFLPGMGPILRFIRAMWSNH